MSLRTRHWQGIERGAEVAVLDQPHFKKTRRHRFVAHVSTATGEEWIELTDTVTQEFRAAPVTARIVPWAERRRGQERGRQRVSPGCPSDAEPRGQESTP